MVLLSTRPGSMAAAMCAAHGSAKDRKRMMRALKGYVAASLRHRYVRGGGCLACVGGDVTDWPMKIRQPYVARKERTNAFHVPGPRDEGSSFARGMCVCVTLLPVVRP